jgi:hypothetical protein
MIDLELVRRNYEQMTDEQLTTFITTDAAGLTREAYEILKEEIRKRKLNEVLIESVDAQNKTYTQEEIDELCEIIRTLPCPVTGKSDQRLNATLAMEVKSFIFFTSSLHKIIVASPPALKQANDQAIASSLAFGLWGIPWGIIKTIESVIVNSRNKRIARMEEPSKHLRLFVTENIGSIAILKNDRERLSQLLRPVKQVSV